ncbi:L-threonylcarbamoyladenylate synthase [Anaerolineales bacterium]
MNPIKTRVLEINPYDLDQDILRIAAETILSGALVAFPTETVYGLGANALDEAAVARIFIAKKRPANDPVILHIADLAQLADIAQDIPDHAYELMDIFWPGPLTLILKKHPNIPLNVTSGGDTIAVRMPSHPLALALIKQAAVPIGAPSANLFSHPSPTTAQHVLKDLDGRIDLILDGGSTDIGLESTILDLSTPIPRILRPGGISMETIAAFLPDLSFEPKYLQEGERIEAPGNFTKHYSPHAPITVYEGVQHQQVIAKILTDAQAATQIGQHVGILLMDCDKEAFDGVDISIALMGRSLEDMAHKLFAAFRQFDAQNVDQIFVAAPPKTGIGLAIWDRLVRASEGNIQHITT